jgi:hypothetical protein
MAEPKQPMPNTSSSPSQNKPSSLPQNQNKPGNPGAPVGMSHDHPEGTHAVTEAKEVGTELIGAVREGATSFFEEQRDRAASEISSVGEMLRRSARTLDQNRSTTIGRYAEDAADEITHFAERLRTRSLGMMSEDVEDFARQWPIAFMAAAMGAGFLAGRFLISSASRSQRQTMARPAPRPSPGLNQPVGGARHDFGAVGGSVSGGNAGYGGPGTREPR